MIVWISCLVGSALATVASIFWIDRPVALFVHHYFRTRHAALADGLSHFPNPLVLLAAITTVGFGLKIISGRSLSWHQANVFVGGVSILFTEAAKDLLKYAF